MTKRKSYVKKKTHVECSPIVVSIGLEIPIKNPSLDKTQGT